MKHFVIVSLITVTLMASSAYAFKQGWKVTALAFIGLWLLWAVFVMLTNHLENRPAHNLDQRWHFLKVRWWGLTLLGLTDYVIQLRDGTYLGWCHTTGGSLHLDLSTAITSDGVRSKHMMLHEITCLFGARPVPVTQDRINEAYQERERRISKPQ